MRLSLLTLTLLSCARMSASLSAAAIRPAGVAANMKAAAASIRAGKLVAFPTETVYGLGASVFDPAAVQSVFAAKQRPASDPLIVHVLDWEQAVSVLALPSAALRDAMAALAEEFWPGPLTMVAPAAASVPLSVTAGTGLVGVRSPDHAVARALIAEAQVPIVAPSANRFGHVSPTTAQHVYDDLAHADGLTILDGGASCRHGIESTVCRVDLDASPPRLVVFRRGAVPPSALLDALRRAGIADIEACIEKKHAKPAAAAAAGTAVSPGFAAPGQLLTHYSPDVPTFLAGVGDGDGAPGADAPLAATVVVDFGGALATLQGGCLAYRDLSPDASPQDAGAALFATLRWTESVEGAKRVVLADVTAGGAREDEAILAVADRMFRAASGRRVAV